MSIDHALAADLLAFLDASPSPWHAVAVTTTRLAAAGFASLDEGERWSLQPGGRYYVVRGGSSLIAFSDFFYSTPYGGLASM